MTTTQITGLNWRRGVEDRLAIQHDSTLSWGGWSVPVDGEFLSGMVVTIKAGTLNEVAKAAGGRFRGLMFTEASASYNDSKAGSPPDVAASLGNGKVFVRNSVLDRTRDYSTAGGLVTSGTGANLGKIVPVAVDAGGLPTTPVEARVGRVQEIQTDGVLMHLFPATI